MKKKYLIICIALTLVTCSTQKSVAYEFPDAMLPHVKVQYIERFDKGQVLYSINCAKCHNTVKNRKQIIPDFKEDQLKGYELRIVNKKHESSLPDSLVTEEELGLIMTFLRYKKKNT